MGADDTGGSLRRRTAAAARRLGQAAKPHVTAPLRFSFWEQVYQRLKGIRLVVTEMILALLALGAVILLIIKLLIGELTTPTTRISVAAVPSDLSAGGFTEAVAEELIYAELATIQATAKTSMKRNAVWRESQAPKFAVPGVGLDLGDLFQQVQQFFGKKDTSITVYVTKIGDQLKFTVRATQEELPLAPDWQIASNESDVIQKAVEQILRATQPYILASYLCDKERRDVRLDECRKTIDEIMRAYPEGSENLARAHNLAGNLLRDEENYTGALAEYSLALEQQPYAGYIIGNIADVWSHEGDYQKAIALHQEAIENTPDLALNLALLRNNYGATLYDYGDLNKAIAEYRWAIALDSKLVLAYRNLGSALGKQGKFKDAMDEFSKALNINPQSADTYREKGKVLRDYGKLPEAIEAFQAAILLDDQDKYSYVQLGDTYRDQGRLDDAVAEYVKAIDEDPKYARAYGRLASVQESRGQSELARAALKWAIARNPLSADPYIEFGDFLQDQKQHDDAIDYYQKASTVDPKSAWAHLRRGIVLYDLDDLDDQGHLADATGAFQQAIALDEDLADAWIYWSFALAKLNEIDEAIDKGKKATQLAPFNADAWKALSFALTAQDDMLQDAQKTDRLHDALKADRRRVELAPMDADAWQYLGIDLEADEQYDKAAEVKKMVQASTEFRGITTVDRNNAVAWRTLCTALSEYSDGFDTSAACNKASSLEALDDEENR